MRSSKKTKEKCLEILSRIDLEIDFEYVKAVAEDLEKRGLDFTESQIVTTRNRRTFHLPIAESLERLYGTSEPDFKVPLVKRQKLNPPTQMKA